MDIGDGLGRASNLHFLHWHLPQILQFSPEGRGIWMVKSLGEMFETMGPSDCYSRNPAVPCPVLQSLKRKEKEYEHEMERLAREKIATQQRLAELKHELSQWMDVLEIERVLRQTGQPEDDQASTSTASGEPLPFNHWSLCPPLSGEKISRILAPLCIPQISRGICFLFLKSF